MTITSGAVPVKQPSQGGFGTKKKRRKTKSKKKK